MKNIWLDGTELKLKDDDQCDQKKNRQMSTKFAQKWFP